MFFEFAEPQHSPSLGEKLCQSHYIPAEYSRSMVSALGFETGGPFVYVLTNIAVWVGVFTALSALSGGAVTGAIIPGVLGGLAFGLTGLFLKQRTGL